MKKIDKSEIPLQINRQNSYRRPSNNFHGPLRAFRLCVLAILLPCLLIAVPIYLRFRVYDNQLYPIGMTDMRLIDNKISTTWCQRQIVRSNATFNAFLLPKAPQIDKNVIRVSMTRQLLLDDDMKEYWGFYLLKGSTVTVSTCVRWPGASLILIRGHRHLHECAYIGDDSSEELEELMALAAEKGITTKTHTVDNPSNNPSLLRKLTPAVEFHDPVVKNYVKNFTFSPKSDGNDEEQDNINAKDMKTLLNQINFKAENYKPLYKFDVFGSENGKITTLKEWNGHKHHATFDNIHKHRDTNYGKQEENNVQFVNPFIRQNLTSTQQPKNQTSAEIFQDVLAKLESLGPRGMKVLEDIKLKMRNENIEIDVAPSTKQENSKEINPENEKEIKSPITEDLNEKLLRLKREIIIKTALSENLNRDEENSNLAVEEGFVPDEHADHHEIIYENTLNDRSNSEFWSSFSSSEEALLNCAGLILSLPLAPHRFCEKDKSTADFTKASFANTITYTVPVNGYYFFVFSSENEVQENYIRAHFDITKTLYNVSESIDKCSNTTETCSLPLDFFSNEKVVFEMPLNSNDSMWNEEFIVISECEPRTLIYLICVLSVPLLILLFAFQ